MGLSRKIKDLLWTAISKPQLQSTHESCNSLQVYWKPFLRHNCTQYPSYSSKIRTRYIRQCDLSLVTLPHGTSCLSTVRQISSSACMSIDSNRVDARNRNSGSDLVHFAGKGSFDSCSDNTKIASLKDHKLVVNSAGTLDFQPLTASDLAIEVVDKPKKEIRHPLIVLKRTPASGHASITRQITKAETLLTLESLFNRHGKYMSVVHSCMSFKQLAQFAKSAGVLRSVRRETGSNDEGARVLSKESDIGNQTVSQVASLENDEAGIDDEVGEDLSQARLFTPELFCKAVKQLLVVLRGQLNQLKANEAVNSEHKFTGGEAIRYDTDAMTDALRQLAELHSGRTYRMMQSIAPDVRETVTLSFDVFQVIFHHKPFSLSPGAICNLLTFADKFASKDTAVTKTLAAEFTACLKRYKVMKPIALAASLELLANMHICNAQLLTAACWEIAGRTAEFMGWPLIQSIKAITRGWRDPALQTSALVPELPNLLLAMTKGLGASAHTLSHNLDDLAPHHLSMGLLELARAGYRDTYFLDNGSTIAAEIADDLSHTHLTHILSACAHAAHISEQTLVDLAAALADRASLMNPNELATCIWSIVTLETVLKVNIRKVEESLRVLCQHCTVGTSWSKSNLLRLAEAMYAAEGGGVSLPIALPLSPDMRTEAECAAAEIRTLRGDYPIVRDANVRLTAALTEMSTSGLIIASQKAGQSFNIDCIVCSSASPISIPEGSFFETHFPVVASIPVELRPMFLMGLGQQPAARSSPSGETPMTVGFYIHPPSAYLIHPQGELSGSAILECHILKRHAPCLVELNAAQLIAAEDTKAVVNYVQFMMQKALAFL